MYSVIAKIEAIFNPDEPCNAMKIAHITYSDPYTAVTSLAAKHDLTDDQVGSMLGASCQENNIPLPGNMTRFAGLKRERSRSPPWREAKKPRPPEKPPTVKERNSQTPAFLLGKLTQFSFGAFFVGFR